MKVQFTNEPSAVMYMALPDGGADVWLRKNIEKATVEKDGEEPYEMYEADEVYLHTNESESYVNAHFEELFNGSIPTPNVPEITLEERVVALEAAMLESIMRGA